MVMAIVIRLGTAADVAAVMGLVREAVPLMQAAGNLQWDAAYPNAEVFAEDVRREQMWVAEEDGVLAGVAAMTEEQSAEYAAVGWDLNEASVVIHRLAVWPAMRGRGVAEALLRQAEAVARARDVSVLRVDTNTENAGTRRLFPKLGYVLAGEIALEMRPGLRFLCYEKRL